MRKNIYILVISLRQYLEFLCGRRPVTWSFPYLAYFRNVLPAPHQNWLVKYSINLPHLPLEPHTCVSESSQHWFRYWLVAYSAPSHYLNQCWVIVNWTLREQSSVKLQPKCKLFIDENASENIVCEKAAILSREIWANWTSNNLRNVPCVMIGFFRAYIQDSYIICINFCGKENGTRQGHHFNALLLSSVAFFRHAPEQMFLKIVCRSNGK